MKVAKYAIKILLIVLVLLAAGFIIWASTPLGPEQEALSAIESDSLVSVNQGYSYY